MSLIHTTLPVPTIPPTTASSSMAATTSNQKSRPSMSSIFHTWSMVSSTPCIPHSSTSPSTDDTGHLQKPTCNDTNHSGAEDATSSNLQNNMASTTTTSTSSPTKLTTSYIPTNSHTKPMVINRRGIRHVLLTKWQKQGAVAGSFLHCSTIASTSSSTVAAGVVTSCTTSSSSSPCRPVKRMATCSPQRPLVLTNACKNITNNGVGGGGSMTLKFAKKTPVPLNNLNSIAASASAAGWENTNADFFAGGAYYNNNGRQYSRQCNDENDAASVDEIESSEHVGTLSAEDDDMMDGDVDEDGDATMTDKTVTEDQSHHQHPNNNHPSCCYPPTEIQASTTKNTTTAPTVAEAARAATLQILSNPKEQAISIRQGSTVRFVPRVIVKTIPPRCDYPDHIRHLLWYTLEDMKRNRLRNKMEYKADGCDWRFVTEEDEMIVCPVTGELIHPVHGPLDFASCFGTDYQVDQFHGATDAMNAATDNCATVTTTTTSASTKRMDKMRDVASQFLTNAASTAAASANSIAMKLEPSKMINDAKKDFANNKNHCGASAFTPPNTGGGMTAASTTSMMIPRKSPLLTSRRKVFVVDAAAAAAASSTALFASTNKTFNGTASSSSAAVLQPPSHKRNVSGGATASSNSGLFASRRRTTAMDFETQSAHHFVVQEQWY